MNKELPFSDFTVKPMMIIPPKALSDVDIKRLRDNGICVVVSKEPSAIKFLDPIPASTSRSKIENAAIALSRKILNPGTWSNPEFSKTVAGMYVELLVKGTPLDPEPQKQEIEKQIFDHAKKDEIRILARQEARAEREAKKSAQEASTSQNKDLNP